MSVIIRSRKGISQKAKGADLQHGGSGGAPLANAVEGAHLELRYSADPAADLMPAAAFLGHEVDYVAILEKFPESPFDPAKRKKLGKLMGIFAMDYQSARSEERRFLKQLLESRNAKEGYAANCSLHWCGTSNAIRRTLALSVAQSRFAIGPSDGFLGAVQARHAAVTLELLGPSGRERLWDCLTRAGTHVSGKVYKKSDRVIERGLVLKALGARRHRLGPWSGEGEEALKEIELFAKSIRGCSREVLAYRTTLKRPQEIQGKQHALARDAKRSLGHVADIAHAEIDPVYAWSKQRKPWKDDSNAQDIDDAHEQMPELDRSPLLQRTRLHSALAQAGAGYVKGLDSRGSEALVDYVTGRDMSPRKEERKDKALEYIEEYGFDICRRDDLEAIRSDAQGIYKYQADRAFGTLTSVFSGATYIRKMVSDLLNAGQNPIEEIEKSLHDGFSLPLIFCEMKFGFYKTTAAVENLCGEEYSQLFLYGSKSVQCEFLPTPFLLAKVLPDVFGRDARLDHYLLPLGLDLMMPPFGLEFSSLGIVDQL